MLRKKLSASLNCSLLKRHGSSLPYAGNNVLGMVREKFSLWERRAPLCPHHVKELVGSGVKVIVQPCTKRIFTNKEYEEAGAVVQDDLSEASLVLGVKRLPMEVVNAPKNYLFFSHVIKAQPYNMDMLDHIFETKARLIDYECITEGGRDDKPRLVAFGKYAGIAGMIDGLQGFGQKLLAEGYSTPFLNVPTSYVFQNLDQAKYMIRNIGSSIQNVGFPKEISPLVFAFTGNGNVAKGAREIFELLPHEYVTVADLPNLASDIAKGARKANKLYGVLVEAKDMVRNKSGTPFLKSEYYSHPEKYEAIFHETILPHISFLANCMYWAQKFPRLITKQQMKALRDAGNKKLQFISDISCDPMGSVEFMSHCTSIESPFFCWNPDKDQDTSIVDPNGVGLLSVEILPTELPRDASEHFGKALMPFLPPLLKSKGSIH